MSQVQTVLLAMNSNIWYEPELLANVTHLRVDDVKQSLRMLVAGELVEANPAGEYKRYKKYRSRQQRLFA